MKRVKIYRWTRKELPHGNFGDEITIPILERLFGLEAVPVETHQAELIGAGSILAHHYDRVSRSRKQPGPPCIDRETPSALHVWGTGIVQDDKPVVWPQRLVFSAVRGSLTAGHVDAHQAVLGDPGILASRLLEGRRRKQHRVGLIPHYIDGDLASTFDLPSGWKVIDPRRPVMEVVTDIAAADLIVSSSLHGLIVADSFNIPSIWVAASRPLAGKPGLKFRDHETARRRSFGAALSYEETLSTTLHRLLALATVPDRDVERWQQDLLKAFPLA